MANTVSGFYQTVVAAAQQASATLVFNLKAIDSVYMDYGPEQAALGRTLNVVIPKVRTTGVADGGVGDITLTDVDADTVPIIFDKHPYDALVIRDFEQFNSPALLRNVFLDSALKGVMEYINAAITALFTTGNFTINAAIAATGGLITTTQFLQGQAVLSDQRVPITDVANMSLLLGSIPWTKAIGNAAWTDAQVAGATTAEAAHVRGEFPSAYGASVKLDQQMPVSGTAPTRSFTAIAMHRWAVAVVTRPLPPPDSKTTEFSYFNFNGLPIRITLTYNTYPKQGWILVVDAGFGLKVVRPALGQIFTVAE